MTRPPGFPRGQLPSDLVQSAQTERRSDAEIAEDIKLAVGDLNTALNEARSVGMQVGIDANVPTMEIKLHVWRKVL